MHSRLSVRLGCALQDSRQVARTSDRRLPDWKGIPSHRFERRSFQVRVLPFSRSSASHDVLGGAWLSGNRAIGATLTTGRLPFASHSRFPVCPSPVTDRLPDVSGNRVCAYSAGPAPLAHMATGGAERAPHWQTTADIAKPEP